MKAGANNAVQAKELFEVLVRENLDLVRAFLLSAVRDSSVADDLLQEAFLIAWKNLDRYDRTRPFGPWVRGIAGKLVLGHRRKMGRSKVFSVDDETLQYLESEYDKLNLVQGETFDEKMEALRDCMQGLTGKQRETIELHYEEGMQCKDIGPRLGLGVEAVKKHLQRGRAALLRCIESKVPGQIGGLV